jgi:hypothetical protein
MKKIIPLIIIIISSCSLPKEPFTQFNKTLTDTSYFPIGYCLSFPSLDFEKWDDHYKIFDKFKTYEINRTQAGLAFVKDGVKIFFCFPSANPYVQLDTMTMIYDNNKVIGEWKAICNRRIAFEDSASLSDNEVYRTKKKLYYDDSNEYFAYFTDKKFKLYRKRSDNNKFTLAIYRKYCIVNKRYIMFYGLSKAGAAINFIGIDNEGRLILDSFYQEERTSKNKYIVFHATMTQYIFKKIE